MARKCVCHICKAKGNTDIFYKVTDEKGRNKYYCNKEEYDQYMNNRQKRESLIKYIAEEIFEYEEGQIVHPILLKRISELNRFYDYEVIHECFIEQRDQIKYWLDNKNFTTEYGMVCYVMKIIESNINDVYKKWKHKKEVSKKQNAIVIDFNMLNEYDNEQKTPKNNNGILEFLDEGDL